MGKKDVLNEFMHAENLTTTELASILQRRTGVAGVSVSVLCGYKTGGIAWNKVARY